LELVELVFKEQLSQHLVQMEIMDLIQYFHQLLQPEVDSVEQEQVTEAPEAREDPAEVGAEALTTDLVERGILHLQTQLKDKTEVILQHLVLAHFKVAAVEEQVK
jgi:hypothetical protein